jgi:hypothetical protein
MNDVNVIELRKILTREKEILQAELDIIKLRLREIDQKYYKEI